MTISTGSPDGPAVLAWDTSPLLHAIRAEKIDLLGLIAQHCGRTPRRNVTTQAVVSEISHYGLPLAGLDWLEVVHVDDLAEIEALVAWMARVAGAKSNHGEATVLAWAEVHRAVAVVDDADARRIGLREGLDVRGSLRVVADAVRVGDITAHAATALVDAMIATGARYPCPRGGFVTWARQHRLL